MKTLVSAFIGMSVGILAMGGTVFNIQENTIYIIGFWIVKQVFGDYVMKPAARELGVPPKKIIRTFIANWLRERNSIQHYLLNHPGTTQTCPICNQEPPKPVSP